MDKDQAATGGDDGAPSGEKGEASNVTREQFEAIKAAQAGSDRKVSELNKQLEELMKALTAEKAEKEKTSKTATERVADLEQKWQAAEAAAVRERLKGAAREKLTSANVKANAALLERLVGGDADETDKLVQAFIEDVEANRAESAKAYARDHGRRVESSRKDAPTTYEQIMQMSEDELAQFTKEELAEIIDRASAKK
jgi:hypothetical protein